MCRWFAYISGSEPCLLEDILCRPDHSIVKQVSDHYLPNLFHHTDKVHDEAERKDIAARNLFFNSDGTGVAFYSTTAAEFGQAASALPQLYKTIIPPTNDVNFKSLCENTSSNTVFAHVRMATSQVQQFNSHPFAFGRHIFMHNGSIAGFSQIRRAMCHEMTAKAYGNIAGSTDSEHLAALYFSYLGEDWSVVYSLQDMKHALERAIKCVIKLQGALPGATVPVAASSLNLCTTDGDQLLAFRYRNSVEEQPPSLYWSKTAGVTLNRKFPGHPNHVPGTPLPKGVGLTGDDMHKPEEHGDHLIIASEPTTRDEKEWTLVPKNEAVMASFKNGHMTMEVKKISV
ncbi:N-terminal nucleophile aminohydrolase [Ceratobasidium sp. AG-I]|nr:N-terminal nucleophile aminohydrolase [Ceratobasidium sp. AG-I]